MQFINITGKKESRGVNEPVVIVAPTPGDFKITPAIAGKLDIKDGDAVLVVLPSIDSTEVYIAKGKAGVPVLDEEGNPTKDKRGRHVYEEGTQFGATVRTASEGSLLLKVTAITAWNKLGGSTELNKHFTLGEGVVSSIPNGDENFETTFYPLVFKSEKPKSRGKKGDKDEDGEEVDEVEDATDSVDEDFSNSTEEEI